MSDIRRPDGPEPTLDEIRRTDDFLDALAAGAPAATQDSADAALAAMLGGWRDEMRWPPDTGLVSESQAVAALNAGLAEKPRGVVREKSREKFREKSDVRQIDSGASRPNRRGLSVVGAVAAAALCIGGFGAVVAGAGPGDALYGLRTMLFGTPKQVRDDQVALAARTEMQQVQQLISQGDWQQAQEKLVAVSTQVAAVGDQEQKQQLLDQFNDLSAKVVDRNPEATAAPGIVYTVPPSATDLVPVVAPTTTVPPSPTSVPSLSESTTAVTLPSSAGESATPSASPATSASAAPATSASATSAAPTTASPTTASSQSAAATTSAAPRTSTTASASTPPTTAAATTTPTTAAATTAPATTAAATTTPTTAAATTTSAEPKAAATTTTTSARAAEAPATTTAAPAATTTAAPATTATPAATTPAATTAASAPASTTAAPATQSGSAATTAAPVTTTTVVPVPVG